MSLNKVTLIGNVGKDPEIRSTQDGKVIASFSIATSESWKDKQGQKQTKSEWHNIVAFEPISKIVQNYVKKGSKLYIEGQIQTRKWQDKDGHDRYTTEIVIPQFKGNLLLLDSRGAGEQQTQSQSKGYSNNFDYDSDVPF